MKRKSLAIALLFLSAASLMAQTITETTLKINKNIYTAYSINLSQDNSDATSLVKKWLKQSNLSTSNKQGCIATLGQVHPDISSLPVDMYAKIEKNDKGAGSIVTITAIEDGEKVTDAEGIKRALNRFSKYVAANEISKSEKELKKAQKTLSSAQSDVTSIEKTITSKQDKIADKQKDIEKYKEKINSKQKEIEDLKEKIKNTTNNISEIEADIKKQNSKKEEALQKATAAEKNVQAAEAELKKYQTILAQ
ncbi:MAG: hypothetical protein IJ764_03345 [Bacteroidales bacterium]|nr:hypothetical protein [Bacteroidales bacterium]